MPSIKHVFLDDGGVLNDNRLRAPQWQHLVGEFFAPRLGGATVRWAAANRAIVDDLWQRYLLLFAGEGSSRWSYAGVMRAYEIDWLRSMAAEVGVEAPASDDDCYALALEATRYIVPRVRSAFADAVPAIRALSAEFELYTASGEYSVELHGYLQGMGVADLFRTFYGADLLEAPKPGPKYYPRLFRHAGVDPAASLVVDDSPEAMLKAVAEGARGVLVRREGPTPVAEGVTVISTLAELPALLARG